MQPQPSIALVISLGMWVVPRLNHYEQKWVTP